MGKFIPRIMQTAAALAIALPLCAQQQLPAAPRSASAVETANEGEVTITWEAPLTDIDGAALDPAAVTYTIVERNMNIVASNVSGLSYTYQAKEPGEEQTFMQYAVFAATAAGRNDAEPATTQRIPVGAPYALPVEESFPGGLIANAFQWASSTGWDTMTDANGITAQDGDNGFVGSIAETQGAQETFYSGKIGLGEAANPTLTFFYYTFSGGANTIDVQVQQGNDVTTVATFTAGSETGGWVQATVPLTAYRGQTIRINIVTTMVTGTVTAIDNIRVYNRLDHNLTATAISAPTRVTAGDGMTVSVEVANSGNLAAEGYTVELYRNGSRVQTQQGPALDAGARTTVNFDEQPGLDSEGQLAYHAVVAYDGDMDLSDNTTDVTEVTVVLPTYPEPKDLIAGRSGENVCLTWTAPDLSRVVDPQVTEGFEACTTNDYDNVAGWTFIDGDGGDTYTIDGANIPMPNSGAPKAYLVVDGSLAAYDPGMAAHSGTKYLASFASKVKPNDDWLISPELNGHAQTVTFWAKAYQPFYSETFDFLYSAAGTSMSDFVKVGSVSKVPGDWTEYVYNVPEGARHFAIRCTSYDCLALFIDDITYTPAGDGSGTALSFKGYNVYRDGARLNDQPVAETAYTDEDEDGHSYYVTAVYDLGESKSSNVVSVSSLAAIATATAAGGPAVSVSQGVITVSGADGLTATVCTADGRLIFRGTCTADTRISTAASGLYIVKVGSKVVKVAVNP